MPDEKFRAADRERKRRWNASPEGRAAKAAANARYRARKAPAAAESVAASVAATPSGPPFSDARSYRAKEGPSWPISAPALAADLPRGQSPLADHPPSARAIAPEPKHDEDDLSEITAAARPLEAHEQERPRKDDDSIVLSGYRGRIVEEGLREEVGPGVDLLGRKEVPYSELYHLAKRKRRLAEEAQRKADAFYYSLLDDEEEPSEAEPPLAEEARKGLLTPAVAGRR
jgi:hypothetical protein